MLAPTYGSLASSVGQLALPIEETSVIECPRCGKNNQPHYKFCLGCGAELPRDTAQPEAGLDLP